MDAAGVYLGGRPPRRLPGADLERITAVVGEEGSPAPATFWTGRGFVGECRITLHPVAGEPVQWNLENPGTIPDVVAGLHRHAPGRLFQVGDR